MATVVNDIRKEKPNVLLVDAGDQFQGTLFYTLYKGKPCQIFMNLLRYDFMTLGNHEFDDGPTALAEFIKGLDAKIVSANVNVESEPELRGLFNEFEIINMNGRNVGIFGFTTEDVAEVSNPGPNVKFENIEIEAKKAVQELTNQGINIIIALSHAGFARDMEIAQKVGGIDVIVGGHTHTLLSNSDEKAAGKYPMMVNSPLDEPVLIVTAQCWGKYLGRLDILFENDGVIEEWSGDSIYLDSSIPEDPLFTQNVKDLAREIEPMRLQVVGDSKVDLVNIDEICRYEECNIGDLVTNAILWATREQNIQIAFYNGGGIRASIPKGKITLQQVLEVLPFFDTIATFQLKGQDIRTALEHSVSRAESPQNEGTGRFLQVAGLVFIWDPTKPVGSRVTDIWVKNPDGSKVALADNETYSVATSNYLRNGGDGFSVFAEKAYEAYDLGTPISDAVVDYLSEFSPVEILPEGRIINSNDN